MKTDVDAILAQLESDLSKIDYEPARIIEMGCFVEVVNLCLKSCLLTGKYKGLRSKEKQGLSLYEYWKKTLNHESFRSLTTYAILDGIKELDHVYGARNKCAHDEPEIKQYIAKRVDKLQRDLLDGVKLLHEHLRGVNYGESNLYFEDYLQKNADRRPGYALIAKFTSRLMLCKETYSNHKKHRIIRNILEGFCDERNIQYNAEPHLNGINKHLNSRDLWETIITSHTEVLSELSSRGNSRDQMGFIRGHIYELIQMYIEGYENHLSVFAKSDVKERLIPFRDQELRDSEAKATTSSIKFKALYLRLDSDNPMQPGWPLRLSDVRLIPNQRKAEQVIHQANEESVVLRDSDELYKYIRKYLIKPLNKDAELKTERDLVLVVELDQTLAFELVHIFGPKAQKPLEGYFKSLLIRLNDDPDDADCLSDQYIENFITSSTRSARITSPLLEGQELRHVIDVDPEVLLIAEEATNRDYLRTLEEAIYYTDIPLVVTSLDPKQNADELTELIFKGAQKISLDQMFSEVKMIRTTCKVDIRKPIQLFIDDDDLNPSLASPLGVN